MYGFPLTLYVLARVFRVDLAFGSGNLWSALLGAGEAAMLAGMTIGYAFVVIGLLLLVRGWRAVYRAAREDRLATGDVYALVRHPQYTGIFLALFGEGVVHWPTLLSVGLFPVIVLAYVRLARREEERLAARFGDEYSAYRARVPMFVPRWRSLGALRAPRPR
jgi:protein-S-isoprenylcysteine O-methyltransferase Ste14